ncbi:MAG: IS3 family transposase, partial [Burkholderiales bacterium]
VHPNQITQWKSLMLERAATVFGEATPTPEAAGTIRALQAKIGQLAMENDFLGRRAQQDGIVERKAMIKPEHELAVVRQCQLLGLARSTAYYQPEPVSEADLVLMRRIDELHLKWPFLGARRLRDQLVTEGFMVGRKHVGTLMRKMGISALYRKPKTSTPGTGTSHRVFPYLLRNLVIDRPNQVWATDITYLPMAKGFMYLVAIMDWASRRVLAWRTSNTLTTDFCVEALQEAMTKYGAPEIFNTDQGSQFTSADFTKVLESRGVDISMDGKGRWVDNVFVERLWRSVKYEEVYLHAYGSIAEGNRRLAVYFDFYNRIRGHQGLEGLTPDAAYFGATAMKQAA